MKRLKLLALSLLVILVTATSGFASVVNLDLYGNPTILGDGSTYIKGQFVNLTFGDAQTPAGLGDGTITLSGSITLQSAWSSVVSLKPKFMALSDTDTWKPIMFSGSIGETKPFSYVVSQTTDGIYSFQFLSGAASGASNPADWSLVSATLKNSNPPASTPIPAAALLLGSGLLGLFGVNKARKNNAV